MPQRRPIPALYRLGPGQVDLTRNVGRAPRYSLEEMVKSHNRTLKQLQRSGA